MPTYTVITSNLELDENKKKSIAEGITKIHSKTTGANTYFAQVIFNETKKNSHFMGGKVIKDEQIYLNGQIRAGRSKEVKDDLIDQLKKLLAKETKLDQSNVWVYIVDLEPSQMVEYGEVLPVSGQEKIWFENLTDKLKNKLITAGVDEVGRGCLAGPVVSAAVILKEGIDLDLLKDSKKITFKRRIEISEHIKSYSYYAIGLASVDEILDLNILQASLLSMKRALEQLTVKPDLTLIDGNFAPSGLKNYKTIINGDEKVKVISAASIIAKVYRDNLMIKLSEKFSNYAWESNFGYGTKAHLDGLKKYGVTSHHRKGFKPIHKILSN